MPPAWTLDGLRAGGRGRRRHPAFAWLTTPVLAMAAVAMARAAGQPDARVLIEASFTLWVAWAAFGALHVFDTSWGDPLIRLLRVLPWPTASLAADRARAGALPTFLFGITTGLAFVALALIARSPAWWVGVAYHFAALAFCATAGVAGAYHGARAVQARIGQSGAAETWLAAPATTFVAMTVGVLVLELGFLEAIRAVDHGEPPFTRAFWVAVSVPGFGAAVAAARAFPLWRRFEVLHGAWIETEEAMSNRWGHRAETEPLVVDGESGPRADIALRSALKRGLVRRSPMLSTLPWMGAAAAVAAGWSTRFSAMPAWGPALAALGLVVFARRAQRLLASHGVGDDGFLATIAPPAQVHAAAARVLRQARRRAAIPVAFAGFALVGVDGGPAVLAGGAAAMAMLQRRPPAGEPTDGFAAAGVATCAALTVAALPSGTVWPAVGALLVATTAFALELPSLTRDRR